MFEHPTFLPCSGLVHVPFCTSVKLLVQISFPILEMPFEHLPLERNEKYSAIGKLTKTTQFCKKGRYALRWFEDFSFDNKDSCMFTD